MKIIQFTLMSLMALAALAALAGAVTGAWHLMPVAASLGILFYLTYKDYESDKNNIAK